jgi:hypothetical protein
MDLIGSLKLPPGLPGEGSTVQHAAAAVVCARGIRQNLEWHQVIGSLYLADSRAVISRMCMRGAIQ